MSILLYKWGLIVLCAMLFIASDSISAHWGKTGSLKSLIVMIFLAPIGYFIFGIINKSSTLAVNSGLVNMLLIIGTILVSIVFFKDPLTLKQMFGLIFAVTAIVLLA